jgi:hypothetical protein
MKRVPILLILFTLLLIACRSGTPFDLRTTPPTTIPSTPVEILVPSTPTYTPRPAPTEAFSEPILAAIEGRAPDFSLAPDRWGIGGPETARLVHRQFINGQWVWEKSPDNFARIEIPGLNYNNFVLKVNITSIDSPADTAFSIYWRLSPKGEYRVYMTMDFSQWNTYFVSYVDTVSTPEPKSGRIPNGHAAGVPNTFMLVAYGQHHALYLNGVPFCYIEDSLFSEGTIGFTLDSSSRAWKIAFENLEVWNLDGVPGLPQK